MLANNPLRNMASENWWTISHITMLAGGLAVPLGLYFGYPLVAAIGTDVVVLGKFGVPYFDKKVESGKEREAADEKARTSPYLRVSYHRTASDRSNGSIIVAFVNTGNGPDRLP